MAWILFLGFIGLILVRVPITMAIGAAVLVSLLAAGFSDEIYVLPLHVLEGVENPSLLAVPFFIMAGNLMNAVGMTDKIFNFATTLVGHFRAGLAQVNVLASMIFAGVSGAAVADIAGLGMVEIKAMAGTRLPRRLRRRADGGVGRHRAHHPTLHQPRHLRLPVEHLGGAPVPGRHPAGHF